VLLGALGGIWARVALIDIGQFYMLAGDLLHGLGRCADRCAILLVGRRDVQRQQVAQRIDGRVYLRSLTPLGPIVTGPRARLRRRLQSAAVEDHRSRLGPAPGILAQQLAQIGSLHLVAARCWQHLRSCQMGNLSSRSLRFRSPADRIAQ